MVFYGGFLFKTLWLKYYILMVMMVSCWSEHHQSNSSVQIACMQSCCTLTIKHHSCGNINT